MNIKNTVLVEDALLNWRYKPNSVSYSNDIIYQINEKGFRDYTYSYHKEEDVFRIFLASDSVGFGANVQMEQSYPKILETLLNDSGSAYRFEVINYSMPGLSIKQKLHLLKIYSRDYYPDIIIIDYAVNDIAFESMKDPEKEGDRKCSIALIGFRIPCTWESYAKKSAFLFFMKQALEDVLEKIQWEDENEFHKRIQDDYYHHMYSIESKMEYLTDTFEEIGKFQRDSNTPVLVPIFPLIYDYSDYKWEDINNLIGMLCRENNLVDIQILENYRKHPWRTMRVQRGDFEHPSVKGNMVAAQTIMSTLTDRNMFVRRPEN